MKRALVLRFVTLILLAGLCLVAAAGCGGSTSGTGGITVQGKVLDTTDHELAGVTVVALQDGATTVTSTDGSFALPTARANSIDLSFEVAQSTLQTTLQNIPESAEEVRATFRLNRESNTVDTSDVSIRERNDDPVMHDDDDDNDSDSSHGGSSSIEDDDDDDNHSSSGGSGSGGNSSSASSGSADDDDDDSSSGSSSGGGADDDDDSSSTSNGSSGSGGGSSGGGSGHDDDDDVI